MKAGRNLWYAAIAFAFVALFISAALGLFSPQFAQPLPKETAELRILPDYEVEHLLNEKPDAIKAITFFPGQRKVIADVEPLGPALVDFANTERLFMLAQKASIKTVIYEPIKERFESTLASLHWTFWAILFSLVSLTLLLLYRTGAFHKLQLRLSGVEVIRPVGEFGESNLDEKRTFDDVAGCDEAIAKLRRVARWLKAPELYEDFGAKIPRGILAVGPPGTGKTLLARALAGEVDANFFSVHGSSFVEMFVGVGAKRVRKLFAAAAYERKRTGKPSVIFIDEIDAIGKKRGQGSTGADSERDQTLNQLLVCMQGFETTGGIVVMAATNMADSLDEALLRPGRFDYRISVDLPDTAGRERIFAIHTRNMRLEANVKLRDLAVRTPQFSGADIEQACNEAAIAAAERMEKQIERGEIAAPDKTEKRILLEDFDIGIDYVLFGDPLLSRARAMSEKDKRNTAFHEAGHCAVQQALQDRGGDPITKVTIEPRTKSLGYMQSHPESDRYCYTEQQLRARIMTAMGGRVAQEYFLNCKDTGASNDFEQATQIARLMVTEFGMSELGPVYSPDSRRNGARGSELDNQIDAAWRRIVDECYQEARRLVLENEHRVYRIADALLAEQTILKDRFVELWNKEESNAPALLQSGFPGDATKIAAG